MSHIDHGSRHVRNVCKRVFTARCYMHSADYAAARCLSVRLSVCLSVTRRYSVETAQHIIKIFHLQVATPRSFCCTKRYGLLRRGPPKRGWRIQGYEKHLAISQKRNKVRSELLRNTNRKP